MLQLTLSRVHSATLVACAMRFVPSLNLLLIFLLKQFGAMTSASKQVEDQCTALRYKQGHETAGLPGGPGEVCVGPKESSWSRQSSPRLTLLALMLGIHSRLGAKPGTRDVVESNKLRI